MGFIGVGQSKTHAKHVVPVSARAMHAENCRDLPNFVSRHRFVATCSASPMHQARPTVIDVAECYSPRASVSSIALKAECVPGDGVSMPVAK